jgi:hypothetical protein
LLSVVVVLVGGWLAGGWLAGSGPKLPRLPLLAGGAAALLVAGAAIPPLTRVYTQHRYRTTSVAQQQVEFLVGRKLHSQRIGVVGLTFGYLLAGPTVSNDVVYVGQPTPHGGMVDIATCRAWRSAVNGRHLDYVAVGPPDWNAAAPPPPAAVWTDGDSAAQAVLHGGNAWVFKLSGPLNPATCQA